MLGVERLLARDAGHESAEKNDAAEPETPEWSEPLSDLESAAGRRASAAPRPLRIATLGTVTIWSGIGIGSWSWPPSSDRLDSAGSGGGGKNPPPSACAASS